MSDARGGYQQPSKPAVASGPGALSQRTDSGPSDPQAAQYMSGGGEYGASQALNNQQAGAPLAGGTPGPTSAAIPSNPGYEGLAAASATMPDINLFDADSIHPDTTLDDYAAGRDPALDEVDAQQEKASQETHNLMTGFYHQLIASGAAGPDLIAQYLTQRALAQ